MKSRKKGFKIIGTEPNFKKPQYDVYFFEDKAELRVAIDKGIETVKRSFFTNRQPNTKYGVGEVVYLPRTEGISTTKIKDDLKDTL